MSVVDQPCGKISSRGRFESLRRQGCAKRTPAAIWLHGRCPKGSRGRPPRRYAIHVESLQQGGFVFALPPRRRSGVRHGKNTPSTKMVLSCVKMYLQNRQNVYTKCTKRINEGAVMDTITAALAKRDFDMGLITGFRLEEFHDVIYLKLMHKHSSVLSLADARTKQPRAFKTFDAAVNAARSVGFKTIVLDSQ